MLTKDWRHLRREAMVVEAAPVRGVRRRLSRAAGPRPALLLGFAGLLILILGGFGYVVVDSAATSRDAREASRLEAEKRLSSAATITAQLTQSVFASSTAGAQQSAAKSFGGRSVDQHAIDALLKGASLEYALVLGSDGELLAASSGVAPAVRARAADHQTHIGAALSGRAMLSDVVPGRAPGGLIEYALPFDAPQGRRVLVEGIPTRLLSEFFSGYLSRLRAAGYLLDSNNRVLGASFRGVRSGGRPSSRAFVRALEHGSSGIYEDGGVERFFTAAPVGGSSWRVVLSERTSVLVPPAADSGEWLMFAVLAAFALAGAACVLLLRRVLASEARVAEVNRALAAVNATLEERVAQRTADAEERASELARSNAELEQFASITSHDLQEPLRKIHMFGDRLRTRLGDGLSEEAADDLQRMQGAAQRMQLLISDLLAYSRVTTRGDEFESVDLGTLTEEVISDLEARVVELNASVDVGELPVVEADRTQMRQLMQNLISNALKFHRPGEPPVIRIRGTLVAGGAPRFAGELAAGERCVITVQDNGIGFDQKYSERVFAAFERLHGRSSYEGTGIGLSIARKIVWRHGGDITVTSAPDQGSTFAVTLPASHDNKRNGRASGDGR
jgi:signal transduction histidine kinase